MKKLLLMLLALILCCSPAMAELGLTDFTATDMNGNEVDQSIFAPYDLTMVNIWGTWCDYCRNELPELSKLMEKLPDNVNMITICEDAASEYDLAASLLKDAGANFQTLIANDAIFDQLLTDVYAFPTTFFLDSSGMPVGEPITGVPSLKNPAQAYASIFKDTLKLLEN